MVLITYTICFYFILQGDNCSGKTTLINALIGDEIFDTPMYISTHVTFTISHHGDRNIVVHKEDDTEPEREHFRDSEALSLRLQEICDPDQINCSLISAIDVHVPLSNVRVTVYAKINIHLNLQEFISIKNLLKDDVLIHDFPCREL